MAAKLNFRFSYRRFPVKNTDSGLGPHNLISGGLAWAFGNFARAGPDLTHLWAGNSEYPIWALGRTYPNLA